MLKFIVIFLLFILCTTTNQFVFAMQNTNSTDYLREILFINLSVFSKAEIAQITKYIDKISSFDNETKILLKICTETLSKISTKNLIEFLSQNKLITHTEELIPFFIDKIFESWEIISQIQNFKNSNYSKDIDELIFPIEPLAFLSGMITCPDCIEKNLGFVSFDNENSFTQHILEHHVGLEWLLNSKYPLLLRCRYLNCNKKGFVNLENIENHIKEHIQNYKQKSMLNTLKSVLK